jgi:(2Fe-2S) ferredoxin
MTKEIKTEINLGKKCIMICQHTACLKNGSAQVLKTFQESDLPEDVIVKAVECQGQCSSGPTVRIVPEETWYCRVKPSDVSLIVEQHLKGGKIVAEKLHPRIHLRVNL